MALGAAAVSLVGRFRHARGVERLQLRWVALAAVLVGLGAVGVLCSLAVGGSAAGTLFTLAVGCCLVVPPVATGAAILRYRLYDLDRIRSRTLAYGLLTLLLGGGYAVVVLGSASSWAETPRWWWRPRPWPWRRCSSRPATASKPWWIGGSTDAATTPPRPSARSAIDCTSRSTWTP